MAAKLKLRLCLALVLCGGFWVALADEPNPIQSLSVEELQLKPQQQELCALLIKSCGNSFPTNTLIIGKRQPNEDHRISGGPVNYSRLREDSPDLTKSENAQLLKLLPDPKVARAISRELALTVLKRWVKQWEIDGTLPEWHYRNLMVFVDQMWPHDPAVITLFRESLVTGGDVAIWELWTPAPGAWDDAMQEPAIRFIEKTAAGSVWLRTNLSKAEPWDVAAMALGVLDAHYSVWATNNTIPPRLSKAALMLFPSLANASAPDLRPGDKKLRGAIAWLRGTHDPAMISVLRPYLDQKRLAGDGGGLGFGMTSIRTCDEAANAILSLLGDETKQSGRDTGLADDSIQSGLNSAGQDQKISELKKRLDALPEKK